VKRIALTQRVEISEAYEERRDALDQRWVLLLRNLDLWPVLLPNNECYCRDLLKNDPPDGVLLTGGNSLLSYGGNAPERDSTERLLVEWALHYKKPLLGTCRGMQLISDYFGIRLRDIEGHVAERHSLIVNHNTRLGQMLDGINTVNSYHRQGSLKSDFTSDDLCVSALSEDGVVMAIEHKQAPLFGVMWHSERENPFNPLECELIGTIFNL